MTWKPDPTVHPSPASATAGPPEDLAYVLSLNTGTGDEARPDAISVVDLRPESERFGTIVGRLEMPNVGDELHHLGWNACSAALAPWAAHPHVERRHLLIPAVRSSRIYVVDVKDDPFQPRLVKVIEADELARKTGYSRPHTVHCGLDGIYLSALGAPGGGGPGGVILLDHDTYDPIGAWEADRGPQYLAYDVAWQLGPGLVLTSEWGTPDMVEDGIDLDLLHNGRYGHRLHAFDLQRRRHRQTLDLGDDQQMVTKMRPAHDPSRSHGFACAVVSREDFSGSVWLWEHHAKTGRLATRRVIEIAAEPAADYERLPHMLRELGVVPPLVTDIALSVDDRWLYVSCWGSGQLRRYDVTDPRHPRLSASVRLGGILDWSPHPSGGPFNGGPQMVEVSLDGRRVYVTNSLYKSWDDQFYPEGIDGWMAFIDAGLDGSMQLNPHVYLPFVGERAHQVRLRGGDSSSDTYCFPS
jgi:selenium-binding protein 1